MVTAKVVNEQQDQRIKQFAEALQMMSNQAKNAGQSDLAIAFGLQAQYLREGLVDLPLRLMLMGTILFGLPLCSSSKLIGMEAVLVA